jgi:hypothetical protein
MEGSGCVPDPSIPELRTSRAFIVRIGFTGNDGCVAGRRRG